MGWAFVTRAGSEQDLCEELEPKGQAQAIAEGLVLATERPRVRTGELAELAFARQAMRTEGRAASTPAAVLKRLEAAIRSHRPKQGELWRWSLQIVCPDSADPHDPRRKIVEQLQAALPEALLQALPEADAARQAEDPSEAQRLIQVWAINTAEVLIGLTSADRALSVHPGGKLRLRRPDDALSRSGLKLEEAIQWAGIGPDKGDLCADLGAAPGGWTQVALARGAAVVAIDPAVVKVEAHHKKFTHEQLSAFEFAPPETLDWVICDMAWRPREVAELLAKWGARSWARQLIANFKLPMNRKASMLREILRILGDGGWRGLRARQLYYDRDEITVCAWLDPKLAARPAQAPFEFRSRRAGEHTDRGRRDDRRGRGRPVARRADGEAPPRRREDRRGDRTRDSRGDGQNRRNERGREDRRGFRGGDRDSRGGGWDRDRRGDRGRDSRGNGWDRDRRDDRGRDSRGGGWDRDRRDTRAGDRGRDSRGGGWDRDRSGDRSRDSRGGGWDRDRRDTRAGDRGRDSRGGGWDRDRRDTRGGDRGRDSRGGGWDRDRRDTRGGDRGRDSRGGGWDRDRRDTRAGDRGRDSRGGGWDRDRRGPKSTGQRGRDSRDQRGPRQPPRGPGRR